MVANDFDKVAGIYDSLVRVVFGKSIERAQSHFLQRIGNENKVLILGGGTGWILTELDKTGIPMAVTYVEASNKMIETSQKKGPFKHITVKYIFGTHDSLPDEQFDVIITNFFLDVFHENTLQQVLKHLNSHLLSNGLWICTDFVKGAGIWQNALIKLMYLFFKYTTNLEGDKLLDFDRRIQNMPYKHIVSKRFYHGMIEAVVYRKI